jgi:hypothetical protein
MRAFRGVFDGHFSAFKKMPLFEDISLARTYFSQNGKR